MDLESIARKMVREGRRPTTTELRWWLAPNIPGESHPEYRHVWIMAATLEARIEELYEEQDLSFCECSARGSVGKRLGWSHSDWCPVSAGPALDLNKIPSPHIVGAAPDDRGCNCFQVAPCGWCESGGAGFVLFEVRRMLGRWSVLEDEELFDFKDGEAIAAKRYMEAWCDAKNRQG